MTTIFQDYHSDINEINLTGLQHWAVSAPYGLVSCSHAADALIPGGRVRRNCALI